METSRDEVSPTEFKVPQPLSPRKEVDVKALDLHDVTSSDTLKVEKSISLKVDCKSSKNCVDVASSDSLKDDESISQNVGFKSSENSSNVTSSDSFKDVKFSSQKVVNEAFKTPTHVRSSDSLNDDKSSSEKLGHESSKNPNSAGVTVPYKEPSWSGNPPPLYSFEIIKNGTSLSTYDIKSSCVTFGRLTVCDLVYEHPSVSRFHAILQFCEGDSSHPKGFYLYDLGSTHGTFLNKTKITSKVYYKLKPGYVIKFGGSSRLHIFQGPEEEETDAESEIPKVQEDVCTWGMGDDAEEETDLSENPFALSTPNEELYLDDPKKTLRGWFEREGYELEYDVEEKGFKTFKCQIQLPVDTPSGDFMAVEASVTGKKKEAVVACALEACRTLDRLGLLRQSHQESRQRKKKKWEENDYYDSDEDTFLDRTGTIEKKREMRKQIEKKPEAETYGSIEAKLKVVTEEINEINNKLTTHKTVTQSENNSESDTLEAYMSSLSDSKENASDKIERRKLRFRLQEAEKQKAHLEKLLDIARPSKLPPVAKYPGMIGKRLKSKLLIPRTKVEKTISPPSESNENEEEEDDESDSEKMETESSSKDIDKSLRISKVHCEDKDVKKDKSEINDEITKSCIKQHKFEVHLKKRVVGCENSPIAEPDKESIFVLNESKLDIPHTKVEKPILSPSKSDKNKKGNERDSELIEIETSRDTDKSLKISKEHRKDCEEIQVKPYGLILDISKVNDEIAKSRTKQDKSDVHPKKRVSDCEKTADSEPAVESCTISSSKKKKKSKKTDQDVDVYTTGNAEYSTWVPPSGQTGDGMTHLNEKYGY